MILLLATLAHAEVPLAPYPQPSVPFSGECAQAMAFQKGRTMPAALSKMDTAQCTGIGMPVSDLADLRQIEAWSVACRDTYAVVVQADAQELAAMTIDRDRWKTAAQGTQKQLERSQRWYRKPGLNFALGVIVTGAAVTGGAVLVAEL